MFAEYRATLRWLRWPHGWRRWVTAARMVRHARKNRELRSRELRAYWYRRYYDRCDESHGR